MQKEFFSNLLINRVYLLYRLTKYSFLWCIQYIFLHYRIIEVHGHVEDQEVQTSIRQIGLMSRQKHKLSGEIPDVYLNDVLDSQNSSGMLIWSK